MSPKLLLNQLGKLTRSNDWRLSFVPFIMGSVYLWLSLFQIQVTNYTILILILSICTSFGFAALGYFINEYFDQKDDRVAGKFNKLSVLNRPKTLALLLLISLTAFLPWIVLPKDSLTYYLIGAEILCFLIYSLPYIKIKKAAFLAGILDAGYAYLIPGLLSFHTFALLGKSDSNKEPFLFFAFLFFVGYRNIFLHQIKDVLKDQKTNHCSLPCLLGVKRSYLFLQILFIIELSLLIAFSVSLVITFKSQAFWLFSVLLYFLYNQKELKAVLGKESYFALLPERHVLDKLYQLWFALIQLILLLFVDWQWILLAPIHLLLFVDPIYLNQFWSIFWHRNVRRFLSLCINMLIYLLFKILGVDLKQIDMSALQFMKSKFNSK
jgi:1,4-dihydroxy-2-naphthoate octaprenyltransferase